MRKIFNKIICLVGAAALSASLLAASACGGVYKNQALVGDISGDVVSNGGFAVGKGEYVYFINGKQSNTADNTFGAVSTGAIKRISKTDLASRSYHKAETVVPEIVHSGNNNGGLFIYGDYVYYSSPSTQKNSDGEIQNSNIVFKRAKLDGTEVMKNFFAQYKDNTIEYRYVLGSDNDVYLLYVAKSEDLYGTAYTNVHSVNTRTGKDTLLAYNVDAVIFDDSDVTNPRIYYTMKVKDYVLDKSYSNYNQVYTVTAETTEANEYDFSAVKDYDAEKDPLYVNCGTLVLDGIGMVDGKLNVTQFNAKEVIEGASVDRSPYTYTLTGYEHGTLFYTRTSTNNKTAKLFAVEEGALLSPEHKPALGNPEDYLLVDGSSEADYTYVFNGDTLTGAFITNDNGLIKAGLDGEGKLATDVDNQTTFYIAKGGKPVVLFTETLDGSNYVYYSATVDGANGYTINRVCYDGGYSDYNRLPVGDDVNEYVSVRILDLDCSNDWYKPEMFDGRIFFSSLTKTMTEYSSDTSAYSHVMVCDVQGLTNAQIDELNDKYADIEKKIEAVDEDVYKNLKNAYRYAHFTGDSDYIDTLIKAFVDIKGEGEEKYYTKATVEKYKSFISATGDWTEFADKRTVRGKEGVTANMRDYYYALLGDMTEENAKTYDKYLKDTYLQAYPESEAGWFESLSTGAKVGFLVGVIGGGILLIAAGAVVALVVVRKRKAKLPAYTRQRVKVDTTDDKSVDVYSNGTQDGGENE